MFGGCGKEMFMNGPKKTKFILWEAWMGFEDLMTI